MDAADSKLFLVCFNKIVSVLGAKQEPLKQKWWGQEQRI
jgi:ribosomal protein L24E